jgi:hypothetical protein
MQVIFFIEWDLSPSCKITVDGYPHRRIVFSPIPVGWVKLFMVLMNNTVPFWAAEIIINLSSPATIQSRHL